jgi:hypothetical protein
MLQPHLDWMGMKYTMFAGLRAKKLRRHRAFDKSLNYPPVLLSLHACIAAVITSPFSDILITQIQAKTALLCELQFAGSITIFEQLGLKFLKENAPLG